MKPFYHQGNQHAKLQCRGDCGSHLWREQVCIYIPTNKTTDHRGESCGHTYIEFTPGTPQWGEMIGPDYTVRVTITSRSRPMGLAFVWAPSLSTGVTNVEFGFGAVRKGQSASASGYVEVYRTDPNLLSLVFQAETQLNHQVGRKEGDGWSVRVGDPPNRFLSYGPYATAVPAGTRTATYRLMLDNVNAANDRLLSLDVFDANSGRVLASRSLRRKEFSKAFQYQDFDLDFTASTGQRLEFRTYWHGGAYVRQDYVRVR
jgi:hypothetical protein